MDPLTLITLRGTCKTSEQCQLFDKLFQSYFPGDPDGQVRKVFDVLKGGNKLLMHPYDVIYSFACGNENNDDDELETVTALAAVVLSRKLRGDFLVRQRLNWKHHVKMLIREGQFKKMYRMSPASFSKLLKMLQPWLPVNNKQSRNASKGENPIVSELILHCTIRYLAGGSYHDIRTNAGMSIMSFYRCVRRGIDAINSCPEFRFVFPTSMDELITAAHDFHELSSHGVLNGCVGALDGWLCRIRVPSSSEVVKVQSYFSGHYQCYGLNVQATCDGSCRFTSLSVLCPGGTSDSKAFYASHTYDSVQDLPDGFFVVGDNAYVLSPTLLIPYSGNDKKNSTKDAFNFFLSQLRIRIEQSFGLLVTKWRVFKKPLEVKFWRTTLLIEACFRLHNFCINERESTVVNVGSCNPETYTPTYEEYLDPLGDGDSAKRKRHAVREAIVKQIKSDGRKRPKYNIRRNALNS